MKKRIVLIMAASFAAVNLKAFANGTFLCMRAEDNLAVTDDGNGNYKYVHMKDSNGVEVYPQISNDWNTYLPLRYICENSGLRDGSAISGELPDGYFRYNENGADNAPEIEICFNGVRERRNINEKFNYINTDGTERTVAIYNIEGSLYAPLSYIAKLTGADAAWQPDKKQIMFISRGLDRSDYIDDNNSLIREKEARLGFAFFNNNLYSSSFYLKTDGETVGDLSEELKERVKSVTRSGDALYYIGNDAKVYITHEDADDAEPMTFTDENQNTVGVTASTVMAVYDKLYGIKTDDAEKEYGRLFCCELDGSGFTYMSDRNVYNLIHKYYDGKSFLFYCEADNKSVIHMIKMSTMDNYTLQITNHSRENMLSDIKQFVIGDKNVFYTDNSGRLHIIDTGRNLEKLEIVRLDDDKHRIYLNSEDGESPENVDCIGYDYFNDILYAVKNDNGGKIFCFTRKNDKFSLLYNSNDEIEDFSLFRDFENNNRFAFSDNSGTNIYTINISENEITCVRR